MEQGPRTEVRPIVKRGGLGWKLLSILLAVIIIAGLAVFAYMQFNDLRKGNEEKDALRSQVSSLQSQLNQLQNKSDEATKDDAEAVAATDDKAIIDTAVAYAHAEKDGANRQVMVSIDKKELPFARAQVGIAGGGGYACIFKKADNVWLRLYCSQSETEFTMQQDEIYGVPESIIKS